MIDDIVLPYPGLRAYRRDESMLFFGREGCVDEMVDRLAATRFLAVLGASGSGKSSLVRTGLLDALELGLHPRGASWLFADLHPGGRPIHNLARALLDVRGDGEAEPHIVATLEEYLRSGPLSIVSWAKANLPADQNLLIIVDQFEELFRYGDYAGREQAEAFVALMLECIRSGAPVEIVITMRSEFLGACALIPGLAEQINKGLYLARRMTREECRSAIEGPARVLGFRIEPKLVTRILNDLAGFAPWDHEAGGSQLERLSRQADQLPLMQHALSRLWQLARERSGEEAILLALDDYLAIGELQGALDRHAAEVTARLSPAAQPLVKPVFRSLIAGANLSDAVRHPMRFAAIVEMVGAPREPVAEVVEAFRATDCNFLRPAPPQRLEDATVIDISHESLIRQWSSLAGWLAEEARAVAMWNRLVDAEARWRRGEGELWSGVDLSTALDWWKRERPTPAWAAARGGGIDGVSRFLDASRDEEERFEREEKEREQRERARDRRQRKLFQAAAVVAMVFAIVAGGFAYSAFERGAELDLKLAELDASYRELDAKNAELDRSNAALQEETRRTEAANLELKSANEQLTEATAAAESAAATAEMAAAQARAAGAAAEAANRRTIAATDNFIIAEVDRRIRAPGLSLEEAERSLAEGRRFLTQMSVEGEDKRRQDLVLARLMLREASVKLERGLHAESLALAGQARATLEGNGSGGLSAEEAVEVATGHRLDAANHSQLGDHPAATVSARAALETLSQLPADAPVDLAYETSVSEALLASGLAATGNQDEAASHAVSCLDRLAAADGSGPPPERNQTVRAHCLVLASAFGDQSLSAGRVDEALATLAQVAPDRRDLEMRASLVRALSLKARSLGADGTAEAKTLLDRAHREASLSESDLRQRPALRRTLANLHRQRGNLLAGSEADTAIAAYEEARRIVDLGDWRQTRRSASDYEAILADYADAIAAKSNWRTDNALLKKYLDATRELLAVRDHVEEAAADTDCAGCSTHALTSRHRALVAAGAVVKAFPEPDHVLDVVRDPERWYAELLAVHGRIEAAAHAADGAGGDTAEAATARREWLGAVLRLFERRFDIPNLPNGDRIKKLGDSEAAARRFLAAHPGAWIVERKLGRILHGLAVAFADSGNTQDALRAANEAVSLFSGDAVKLLADWHRSGDGPVARDLETARRHDEIYRRRGWGLVSVRLKARDAWQGDDQPAFDHTAFIEDATGPDDPVIARIADQLVSIEAIRLDPGVRAQLEQIVAQSRAAGASFFESVVYEFSDQANSADWIAGRLDEAYRADDLRAVEDIIVKQWGRTTGRDRIRAALAQLLAESGGESIAEGMTRSATAIIAKNHSGWAGVAELFLDVLIERGAYGPEGLAELYRKRAEARTILEEKEKAEADRLLAAVLYSDDATRQELREVLSRAGDDNNKLIAIVLEPDQPDLLNSLAFDWADQNKEMKASLILLERAAALAPGEYSIRDSLGWAYVQSGDIDRGKPLIESALRDSPDHPEIIYHLADIDRRLGNKEQARAGFERALGLSGNLELTRKIIEKQQLLVDGEDVDAIALAEAARLAAATRDWARRGWSTDEIGVAIRGFDPVSYFTKQHPELGSVRYHASWGDALWLFASAAHRDAFVSDPLKYAPAYGGFCAFCAAQEHKLHGDPAAWAIHEGKLYIHQSIGLRNSWVRDAARYIRDADAKWPSIADKASDPDVRSVHTSRIAEAMARIN